MGRKPSEPQVEYVELTEEEMTRRLEEASKKLRSHEINKALRNIGRQASRNYFDIEQVIQKNGKVVLKTNLMWDAKRELYYIKEERKDV
jgi:hypothetical protein